jgi:hypothetical protein
MKKVISWVFKWHPFVVLVVYATVIAGYRRYLDSSLSFIRPKIPAAHEDILGFGFWVPWLVLMIWLALACYFSYRSTVRHQSIYWLSILSIFSFFSFLDFYLYGVLEEQVLAR